MLEKRAVFVGASREILERGNEFVGLKATQDVLEARVIFPEESMDENLGHAGLHRSVKDRGPSLLVDRHERLSIAVPVATHLHDAALHAPRLEFVPDGLQGFERTSRTSAGRGPDKNDGRIISAG
jgi:hypothetical protein